MAMASALPDHQAPFLSVTGNAPMPLPATHVVEEVPAFDDHLHSLLQFDAEYEEMVTFTEKDQLGGVCRKRKLGKVYQLGGIEDAQEVVHCLFHKPGMEILTAGVEVQRSRLYEKEEIIQMPENEGIKEAGMREFEAACFEDRRGLQVGWFEQELKQMESEPGWFEQELKMSIDSSFFKALFVLDGLEEVSSLVSCNESLEGSGWMGNLTVEKGKKKPRQYRLLSELYEKKKKPRQFRLLSEFYEKAKRKARRTTLPSGC